VAAGPRRVESRSDEEQSLAPQPALLADPFDFVEPAFHGDGDRHGALHRGNAIADVLFGDVNPSGKLPVTVPRSVGQVPIYYSRLPTGRPGNPEDKYTNKYLDLPLGPLYPFGFGLSYTRFEYSDLRVDGLTVSAVVRNAGDRAGDEIVQFYVNEPVASESRPLKELQGFQRITLSPGQSRRVTFTLTRRGKFNVWIGPDSERGLSAPTL